MLTVVIPTLNRIERLTRTIRTVLQDRGPLAVDLVVVDQSDEDKRFFPDKEMQAQGVRVIYRDYHNVSKARNDGSREVDANILIFVDDDIDIAPGFLAAHWRQYAHEDVAAVTGPILEPDGHLLRRDELSDDEYRDLMEGRAALWNVDFEHSPNWAGAGNLSCRRSVFEGLEGFDEKLYRFNEDAEFCHRLRHAGYRLVYSPEAVVIHRPHSYGGTRNEMVFEHQIKAVLENNLHFFRKVKLPLRKRVKGVWGMFKTHALRGRLVFDREQLRRIVIFVSVLQASIHYGRVVN